MLADREVSVGDYVLAGGEAAAVVIIEAIARLLPGAVGDEDSVATDSYSVGILDSPYYTRPREFRGHEVPEVLVSGDHASVARWRREQALKTTAQRRPELLRNEVLTESEREFLSRELEKEIVNG
jgi:tRNA (guanine37-N1)-methyltransferase